MKYALAIFLPLILGCCTEQAASTDISPRILPADEAEPFISICRQVPPPIQHSFELSSLFKSGDVYLQAIRMPSKRTFVILSGLSTAGLIVFDENKRIAEAINWGGKMREHFPLRALDKAYYRFEQERGEWSLFVEYHAFSEEGDQYLWQFYYTPHSRGSSKRYRLKDAE